jgi:hypothetical protein
VDFFPFWDVESHVLQHKGIVSLWGLLSYRRLESVCTFHSWSLEQFDKTEEIFSKVTWESCVKMKLHSAVSSSDYLQCASLPNRFRVWNLTETMDIGCIISLFIGAIILHINLGRKKNFLLIFYEFPLWPSNGTYFLLEKSSGTSFVYAEVCSVHIQCTRAKFLIAWC